jgi:hypothetical protein
MQRRRRCVRGVRGRLLETGKKVSKAVMRGLNIVRNSFHGEWNYTFSPRGKHAPHELP